jgi:hypothetical protein
VCKHSAERVRKVSRTMAAQQKHYNTNKEH